MSENKNVQDTHISEQMKALHGALIRVVSALNRPRNDEKLIAEAGIQLDRALFSILISIERLGPIGVVELAERAGRDYTTVSRQVAKLEKLGLIIRQHNAIDRRIREAVNVPQATADTINTAKQNGGRIFAVGTTVTRCLESAYSREHNCLKASSGWTALYIHPGYQLKVADCLLTNLHQPKTTHMVLTGQFAGVDLLMKVYASEDIQSCQFDMFGDCMLIMQDEGQG